MDKNKCIVDISNDHSADIKILELPSTFSVMEYFLSVNDELTRIEEDLKVADEDRSEFLRRAKSFINQHYHDFQRFDIRRCFGDEDIVQQNRYREDNSVEQVIQLSRWELKHSVSWYLFTRIDAETSQAEDRLVCAHELSILSSKICETIKTLRESKTQEEARQKLERSFGISAITSDYVVNRLTLSELASINKDTLKVKHDKAMLQLNFIRSLKS